MANDRYRAKARNIVVNPGSKLQGSMPMHYGFNFNVMTGRITPPVVAHRLKGEMPFNDGFNLDVMVGAISPPVGADEVFIPSSINQTGTVEVSDLIQAELNKLGPNKRLKFQPGATYWCDKPLFLTNKTDFIIDYNGGTLIQKTFAPFGPKTTIASGSNGASVQTGTINIVQNADSDSWDDFGVVLIEGTRGPGTVSEIKYTSKTATQLLGCRNTYKVASEDPGVLATGQRIVQPIQKSLVRLQGDLPSDDACSQWILSRCRRGRFTSSAVARGTSYGSSRQGGTAEVAYIPNLEFCHNFRIYASSDIEIDRINHGKVFGEFVYLQWIGSEINERIWVHDCNQAENGRIGVSPMAVDDFEYGPNMDMTAVRRSFFDIEPPSNTCRTTNMWVHDSHFGSKRLYFLAASGGQGKNVPVGEVVFENIETDSPVIIEYMAPDNTRRGPLRLINVDTVVPTATYGTPNGHLMRCRYVDEIEITGGTFPLQVRAEDMRLLEAINCTGITSSGNNLAPETNDAAHQRRVGFWDFFAPDTTDLENSSPPFYIGAFWDRVSGPVDRIVNGSLSLADVSGGFSIHRASAVLPSANHQAEVQISSVGMNNGIAADYAACGACIRMHASAETYYRGYIINDGPANVAANWDFVLEKVVAGVITEIGRVSINSIPKVLNGVGDKVMIRAIGTTISGWFNGVQKLSVTDSSIDGVTVGGTQWGILHARKQTTALFININLASVKCQTT